MTTQTYYFRATVTGFHQDIDTCGIDFGVINGRHKDWFAADRALRKANKHSVAPVEMLFESTDKLEVGEQHVQLVWTNLVEQNRAREIRKCAEVIENLKTGVDAETACKCLFPSDEFNNEIPFDDWCAKWTVDAQQYLDEQTRVKQERAEQEAKEQSIVKSFSDAASEITYSFPAVKGIQAKKEYYIAQVPFKYLVKFFTFADEELSPELRAQRKVNEKHAADIGQYVIENRDDYVLPSLTVSVNAAMRFDSIIGDGLAGRLGVLHIPVDAVALINDGQHRRKAAEYFLKEDKTLKDETISVIFYFDEGLTRSKQIFADLNANLSKPSAAINALYDGRNPFNRFVLDALARHPNIDKLVDKENTTIGAKSESVWSLVHWKKFAEKLLNVKESTFDKLSDDDVQRLDQFFDLVVSSLCEFQHQWRSVMEGELTSEDMRKQTVSGHAVYLESMALALSTLIDEKSLTVRRAIKKMVVLDTDKSAEHWDNRCVKAGRMVKTTDSVKLTAGFFLETANLTLTDTITEAYDRYGFAA